MMTMNWLAICPELVLLGMTCLIALVDLFVDDPKRTPTFVLTLMTLAAVAGIHLGYFNSGVTLYAMQNMVVSDPMGHLLGFFAALAVLVTLVYARNYAASRDLLKGEFFTLSLFVLLGISVMLSGNHFLVIYLGLELMSLSLYAMVALRRDHAPSTEAAMKYFVLGALASGFLLYGLSMLYGATGALNLQAVHHVLSSDDTINRQVLALGLVFIVAGLAFKFGVVPFHMWVPDVYQGAPTGVTLMVAGAPKLAAFAIAMRLLVEGMIPLANDWQQMLIVLSVASMILGNLAAIAQTNLKRMLAYSAIAQLGFMLLGLTPVLANTSVSVAATSFGSSMFYVITYIITTLGTFGLILFLSRPGFEAEQLSDLAGLNKRSPLLAAVMATFMFSLAGIPPTVGFYAKLAVLQSLVATDDRTYITLAVVAVLLSLVGAFYYLRAVKIMYFDEPQDQTALPTSGDARFLLSVNGAAVLALGIAPGWLMSMCVYAVLRALST